MAVLNSYGSCAEFMGEEAENQIRILVLMLMRCQARNKMNSKERMQVQPEFCKVSG